MDRLLVRRRRCAPATTGPHRSRCLAPQRHTRRTHGRPSSSIPGSRRAQQLLGQRGLRVMIGADLAAKIACVPHSANATTRACGNAACSPLFTPGRPKNSSLPAVSATSRHVPSIATSRRPANHTPGVSGPANGRATRANNAGQRLRPQPLPSLEDRRLARQPIGLAPPRRPRQPIGQLRQHILIRALRVQPHPDREVRHHPRRQRPMPLLGPARLSDHLIDQRRQGTPASTPPPTPDPTTDDPTPASANPHEACPTNYTHVILTERYWA